MNRLLIVPTEFEWSRIPLGMQLKLAELGFQTKICGFGLVASAAKTMQLVCSAKPDSVILIGISGLYRNGNSTNFEIGSAAIFGRVACYGVGVGAGGLFQSAAAMGWNQVPRQDALEQSGSPNSGSPMLESGDSILLAGPQSLIPEPPNTLLSVTAASANESEVKDKMRMMPDAIAEDMEGYGVAMACLLSNTPLTIIRGFSNWAGDRNHSKWQIEEALNSACQLAIEYDDLPQ
ncbi:futalosine hydrolase [Pirellulaceae bacterium SH449]